MTQQYLSTCPIIEHTILLHDDQGHPLLVDADLDFYFVGAHTYKKTIHFHDDQHWVDDYGMHNALAGYQHKPRLLQIWIWEVWYANSVPRGYTVVLKEQDPEKPPDYRINNLLLAKKTKSKKEEDAA
jgi:hypothetical protein